MNEKSNESGSSRQKHVCSGRVYENTVEKILFESESDNNFDCTYSGSDYIAADDSDSSESNVLLGNIQQLHVQSIIPNTEVVENVVDWKEEEMDMSNFAFTKQNKLFVPIPGEGIPLDFFLLFDDTLFQLLVDETNNYAKQEFLRVCNAPRARFRVEKYR